MKLQILSVHDAKAEAFLPPFFLSSIGQATRAFSDAINSPSHQFGKHPYDYTLFHIGEFDDGTGITENRVPKSLGNGVEFRRTELNAEPEEPDNVTPIYADSPVLANEARRNSKK